MEQINDPLVWFCCNDDHIFIDYELDLLKRMESACQSHLTSTSPFLSFVPTHWPEYVCVSQAATEEHVDYCVCLGKVTNSLQVVSKALLRYWWFEHDYGGAWLPRTDTGTLMHAHAGQEAASKRISISSPDNYPVLVAFRELVRHYDGYSHVSIDPDACPPLRIPEGFFEGKIKIAYGADTAQPGCVLVNPCKNHTFATDPNGADWRRTLEDLPLFWRSRIESVEVNDRLDPNIARRLRNQAVADMATQYYAMPMKKIQIALRFSDQRSPEVEFNALQSFVFKHRLKQHYAEMNLKRTAEGVIESQQLYQWRQQAKNDATPA